MKTLKGWHESQLQLTPYLQPGDAVEAEFADWALNLLPPAYWSSQVVQIGEPNDHIAGRPTFATFYREGGAWFFAGYCHRGKISEPHPAATP
jgi:hypothetical protein